MDISPYLQLMVKHAASDLFITTNSPYRLKVEGKFLSVGEKELTADITESIAKTLIGEDQWSKFLEKREYDMAVSLPDGNRFRVNVFFQRGNVSLVIRLIPSQIPKLAELNLPGVLADLVLHKRGMIIMAGATGSGKSTTLASMIDHLNTNGGGHIITIEDPIEFSHSNKKCIINQREVGIDTVSYSNALKSALREAPNAILIGESRDRETIESVLELCNTGHLALTTLHANNSNQAIERIINMFPQNMHAQVFMDLSLNLRAVISQRLVPTVSGKRCAAVEIMINTPHIAELILHGEISKIKDAMKESSSQGMQTFDQALMKLYQDSIIYMEDALNTADSRTNLEALINFG